VILSEHTTESVNDFYILPNLLFHFPKFITLISTGKMAEQNDTATKKAELEEKNTLFRDVFIGSVEAALKEGDKEEMRRQLGPWSPKFVKSCATKFLFMLVFSLLAIVQGSSFTYFSATITTLEKRLKISSETASELIQIWNLH